MLKKAVHHIRHTRPKWYKEYHEWQYHGILHWATFIASSIVILLGFITVLIQLQNAPVKQAGATANTQVRQSITGGALTIAHSGDERLATVSASVSFQDSTGDLGIVTVTDNRGTGAGWSATATASNFYYYNNEVKVGTTSAVYPFTQLESYPFATSSAGTYTITIAEDGALGAGKFDWTSNITDDGANQYGVTLPATDATVVSIGDYNYKLTFAARAYVKGESWTMRVDTIPVQRFRITPSEDDQADGNVTAGSLNFFDLPTENVGLLTAAANYGMGQYTQTNSPIALGIPANSYAQDYISRIVLTAN